jgi:hypothetical protein
VVSRQDGSVNEVGELCDQVPVGWSLVVYDDRRYAVTRSVHGDGRSESILAEALDGSDLVSANLYRLGGDDVLKPCEMPADKVLDFLRGWQPEAS